MLPTNHREHYLPKAGKKYLRWMPDWNLCLFIFVGKGKSLNPHASMTSLIFKTRFQETHTSPGTHESTCSFLVPYHHGVLSLYNMPSPPSNAGAAFSWIQFWIRPT